MNRATPCTPYGKASRRSWRIGQGQPVRVFYLHYEETMQSSCLRLMGKKLLVSLAMEGKFCREGLQSLEEDDDMLTAMPDEPERLRARAAIALGPVLEQAEMDGFEDPDDVPITQCTFRIIQDSLQKLHFDNSIPKEVRRRILEASVRAPESWHSNAISAAYSSGDKDWMLTAVFSMRWVRGFDHQILEALKSDDPEIHYQAVNAAGNWELDAAWPPIVALLNDADTPKPLLLAAIGAAASIRPQEAGEILMDLAASDDEEIAEAADEAIAMSEPTSDEDDDENDVSEWI